MSVQDRQAVGENETGAVTVGLWAGIKQKERAWRVWGKYISCLIYVLIGQPEKS